MDLKTEIGRWNFIFYFYSQGGADMRLFAHGLALISCLRGFGFLWVVISWIGAYHELFPHGAAIFPFTSSTRCCLAWAAQRREAKLNVSHWQKYHHDGKIEQED